MLPDTIRPSPSSHSAVRPSRHFPPSDFPPQHLQDLPSPPAHSCHQTLFSLPTCRFELPGNLVSGLFTASCLVTKVRRGGKVRGARGGLVVLPRHQGEEGGGLIPILPDLCRSSPPLFFPRPGHQGEQRGTCPSSGLSSSMTPLTGLAKGLLFLLACI